MAITDRNDGAEVVGALQVGIPDGTELTQARVYSSTINPASVAANTVAAQTFTVTGLTTSDKVLVNPGVDLGVGIGAVRVSAANTLSVEFVNPTAGAVDPASSTWLILAVRS